MKKNMKSHYRLLLLLLFSIGDRENGLNEISKFATHFMATHSLFHKQFFQNLKNLFNVIKKSYVFFYTNSSKMYIKKNNNTHIYE